jgi:hypothetical protein
VARFPSRGGAAPLCWREAVDLQTPSIQRPRPLALTVRPVTAKFKRKGGGAGGSHHPPLEVGHASPPKIGPEFPAGASNG